MKTFFSIASLLSLGVIGSVGVVGCSADATGSSETESATSTQALETEAAETTEATEAHAPTRFCRNDADCEPGTSCQGWAPRRFGKVPAKCLPIPGRFEPKPGGACHSDGQCVEGETCEASVPVDGAHHFGIVPAVCKKAEGKACATNADCHGLRCEPICPVRPGEIHCDAVGSFCR